LIVQIIRQPAIANAKMNSAKSRLAKFSITQLIPCFTRERRSFDLVPGKNISPLNFSLWRRSQPRQRIDLAVNSGNMTPIRVG
jgi:hypothetical protein